MKTIILLSIAILCLRLPVAAQLSIEDCYTLASANYPSIRQRGLIEKSRDFSTQNATTGYLPTVSIVGQFSHQSDVTSVPSIPGADFTIPALSKDQYKVYGDIALNLYDGGNIKNQKQQFETNARIDDQNLEVELYTLRERVNQVFFGILLLDGRLAQNELHTNDLQASLRKINASISNGTALRSNADIIQAEILNANQSTIELQASRSGYVQMLAQLIGRELPDTMVLTKPAAIDVAPDVTRPELTLYDYRSRALDANRKMLNTQIKPKLSTFLQVGYGRPGLNMLDTKADSYYVAGLRLNWNLTAFYTSRKEKELLNIKQSAIEVQRETFLFNTRYQSKQQASEVNKLRKLYDSDEEIIRLRKRISQTASSQFENGVIDATDFLHELNAENQARQNRAIHEVQLLMALYTLQTTNGI